MDRHEWQDGKDTYVVHGDGSTYTDWGGSVGLDQCHAGVVPWQAEILRLAEEARSLKGQIDALENRLADTVQPGEIMTALELGGEISRLDSENRGLKTAYDKLLQEAKDDAHRAEVARDLAGDRISALEAERAAIDEALLDALVPDQDAPLVQRVRDAILYAQAGNEYGVPALKLRIAELEEEVERLRDGIDTAIDQLQTREVAAGVVLHLRRLRR